MSAGTIPGHRVVGRHAPDWPARLEHLGDPPSRLWVRGSAPGEGPAVAVVGARRASLVGLAAARVLAGALTEHGFTVISGMAVGIDGEAHRGALDAGGRTVAVLGCGVDVCYPARHRALRDRILQTGGTLLSEDPPSTLPAPWRFPRRNRLIAALAVMVVVVEAGERSGALSTARCAVDLGRDIAACPGSVASEGCRGSNRLIRDGAVVCLDAADVVDAARRAARLDPAAPLPTARLGLATPPDGSAAAMLVDLLANGPAHPDEVAEALGLDAAATARLLTEEELRGSVRALPGGLVEAVPRRDERGSLVGSGPEWVCSGP